MGIVAGLGAAAAAASLAGSVSNLAGGGSGTYGPAGMAGGGYGLTGQAGADNAFQSLGGFYPTEIGPNSIWGYARSSSPVINALAANPYAGGYQDAANKAAGYAGGTLAPMQAGGAANLYGAGNQIYQTAFDPQQALYNRTQQQVSDQANAINAISGLSGSPYGAGVAGQTLSNFNIDWQNQRLARQLQGVQGAGTAYTGASALGNSALGTMQTAGAIPYSTYAGIEGDKANAYQLGQGIDLNAINAAAEYLGLGQSGTQLAQRANVINSEAAQQQYKNQQGAYAGLGQALSGFSKVVPSLGSLGLGPGSGSYDPYSSSLPSFLGGYGSYGGFNDAGSANDIAGFAGGFG